MSNGTVIICFGVGDVECKNTIALPHYANGIVTSAIKFPEGTSPDDKAKVVHKLEQKCRDIQKIIAKATGGSPYEFTGDPNALPECGP